MNRQLTDHTSVTFLYGEPKEAYLTLLVFPITEFYLWDWYYFLKEGLVLALLFLFNAFLATPNTIWSKYSIYTEGSSASVAKRTDVGIKQSWIWVLAQLTNNNNIPWAHINMPSNVLRAFTWTISLNSHNNPPSYQNWYYYELQHGGTYQESECLSWILALLLPNFVL